MTRPLKLNRFWFGVSMIGAFVIGVTIFSFATGKFNSEASPQDPAALKTATADLRINNAGIKIYTDKVTQLKTEATALKIRVDNRTASQTEKDRYGILTTGKTDTFRLPTPGEDPIGEIEKAQNALDNYTEAAAKAKVAIVTAGGNLSSIADGAGGALVSDLPPEIQAYLKTNPNNISEAYPGVWQISQPGTSGTAAKDLYYSKAPDGTWQWTDKYSQDPSKPTVWTAIDKKDANGNSADLVVAQQLASGATTNNGITEEDITKFLKWVARQAITYVLVIAMIFIILAGYIYITSLGNTTKVEQAKQMLLYTLIGVLVVMGAYLAVNTLLSQVATTPSSDPTLIAPTPSLTPAKTP